MKIKHIMDIKLMLAAHITSLAGAIKQNLTAPYVSNGLIWDMATMDLDEDVEI